MAKSALLKEPPEGSVPWADFLSSHPPDKLRVVSKMGRPMDNGPEYLFETPELKLNCKSEVCGGVRTFDCVESSSKRGHYNYWGRNFLDYKCRNCRETTKLYALLFIWDLPEGEAGDSAGVMRAIKLGEWPPLGPSTPRKLRQFLGDDIDLFEQGQRAEGQGMGIGAFGYYRRVVENRRTQLFDKLIEAAKRLGLDNATVTALADDRDNWQFSKSVETLKSILPESLKIQGHSPLALLHNALSHNLHNESDEVCLQAAQDIRIVLTFLVEQLANLLKERSELEQAVGRLKRPTP